MNNDTAFAPLDQAWQALAAAVRSLPEDRFLAPMHGWSGRDIVAHLIGWNRHMIEASSSILHGETPAYYADAPGNYRALNAAHVANYPSRSKDDLLHELEDSLGEFRSYVRSLPPEEFTNSHGVLHYSGRPATVGGIIRSLTQDYLEHAEEIRQAAAGS